MNKNKWIGFAIFFMSISVGAELKPCAVVQKYEKGVQSIPAQGKVLSRFETSDSIECQSMLTTHQGNIWLKTANEITLKFGPESFFEFGKDMHAEYKLYRGQLLAYSGPLKTPIFFSTPNGKIEFTGGVVWLEYNSENKMTTVAVFNRKTSFSNKFNSSEAQVVKTGEISRLVVSNDRVVPSQPEVMSASSVLNALNGLKLDKDEMSELVAVTKKVYESRSQSMTAELEDWKKDEVVRAPAAERQGKSIDSVNPEQAELTLKILRERLYGEDTQGAVKPVTRKPASAVEDTEYKNMQKTKQQEEKKVIRGISDLKDNE